MAGLSVGTFAGPVVDYLSDYMKNYMKDMVPKLIGWGLADKVKKWEDDLKIIRAWVDDAEQKQFSNNAIRIWLGELKDVALDMEDVLDLLAIRGPDNDLQTLIQKILQCSCLDFMGENLSIEKKVAGITGRLEAIQKQNETFQFSPHVAMQQQTLQTEDLRSQRETTSAVSNVFGLDEIKKKTITRVFKDNLNDESQKNYVMIPIVGAGGIGKTTLAQLVYNDEQLKKMKFDFKAWVCVSDVFDVKRITTSIIKKFDDGAAAVEFNDLDQAQQRLMQLVMGKKFLIVLDDIWNDNYNNWEKLQTPFEQAAKGSRVITTTRDVGIARMMNTNSNHDNIIHLQGLSDDACWEIVREHANNKSDLAEMKDDIIGKCRGSPLAAKVLGGLLKTKDTIREWQSILNTVLSTETNKNSILPILRLSYNHLPSHLKCLFAYCSVFPKDSTLEEMEVVSLWMAQRFLPVDQPEKSTETIGQDYFRELVWRSLLEVHPRLEKKFIMHDLLHDLALQTAGDIYHEMDTRNLSQVDKNRARHVIHTDNGATSLGSAFPMTPPLRTLVCSSLYDVSSTENLSCLRTLMLCSKEIEELPDCIGDFKLLRLLYLKTNHLKKLPISINNLSNLQTLWIDCYNLEEVPDIGSLKKLRHLHIGYSLLKEMPLGIENLTSLRSLSKFVLGNGHGSRIKDLKNLNHLQGELIISGLQEVSNVDDAKQAQLHEKCSLDEVSLCWGYCEKQDDYDNTQENVLKQLKPPTSIKACKLVGYMGRNLPAWLGDPFFNVVAIELKNFAKCEGLPPLGQLTRLERLEIEDMKSIVQVGREFYGDRSNAFPALKNLKFYKMPSWQKWVHPDIKTPKAFAKLEGLKIEGVSYCGPLQGRLPPNLPHLRTLEISECKEMSISLASLPSLVELVVSDCYNIKITNEDSCKLASFTKLEISGCQDLVFCSPGHLHLPVLQDININRCMNLKSLPSQMLSSTSLQRLNIEDCEELQCNIEGRLPTNLKQLHICGCKKISILLSCLLLLEELVVVECDTIIITSGDSCELANLTKLQIGGCPNLVFRSPGHLHFPALQDIEIWRCENLESLPSQMLSSTSLQRLDIEDCPKVQCILEGGLHINLKYLCINGCEEMSVSLPSLPSLVELVVTGCEKIIITSGDSCELAYFTKLRIVECPNLVFRSSSHLYLPALQDIDIWRCENLESLPSQMLSATSLKRLNISCCPKVQRIPVGGLYMNLKYLCIDGCKEMSISLPSLPSLVDLVVVDCQKIIITSGDSCELAYLTKLEIRNCPNLVFCSPGHLHLPNLKDIRIWSCENIENLPSQMFRSTSLERLEISACPKVQCILLEGGLPINLKHLSINRAKIDWDGAVKELWGLHCRHSLQSLTLWDVESEKDISVPSSLCEMRISNIKNLKNLRVGNCTNLTSLQVSNCSDLDTLDGTFTSLKKLYLIECPKLHSLPQGILNSLEELTLDDVGSSTDAVERIPGPDLDLPSSLRRLEIGGFQNLKSMKCSALPNLTFLKIKRCPMFESIDDDSLPPQLLEVTILNCELIKQHLKSYIFGRIKVDGISYSLKGFGPNSIGAFLARNPAIYEMAFETSSRTSPVVAALTDSFRALQALKNVR